MNNVPGTIGGNGAASGRFEIMNTFSMLYSTIQSEMVHS